MSSTVVPPGIRHYAWLLLLPVAFMVYSASFKDFPIMERRHSVLAEADTACFALMMRDFHLTKQYGDPYKLKGRDLGDVAQKHKIHHVLYLIVASPLYRFFSWAYQGLGVKLLVPLYSVNATLACLNLLLLFLLLSRVGGVGNIRGVISCFYAVALNTWILGSVPESWTLSATLVLLFVLLLAKGEDRWVLLSAYIGFAMLNNIFLCTLGLFLVFVHARKVANVKLFLLRSVVTGLVAVCTWAVLMTGLSMFDGSLSPLEYVQYTLWFKEHIAPKIIFANVSYWMVAITNLFINSVVSNQTDPYLPKDAIRLTFQQSALGVGSTILYLSLAVLVTYRSVLRFARRDLWAAFRTDCSGKLPTGPMILFCLLWVGMAVLLDTAGTFLFSTIIVPLMMLIIGTVMIPERSGLKYLLYATVVVVLINNVDQILKFRHALVLVR